MITATAAPKINISSLHISMEFGIGIGAFLSGMVYGNAAGNFDDTFLLCGLLAGLSFIFHMLLQRQKKTGLGI